jgi:hypothetical protein
MNGYFQCGYLSFRGAPPTSQIEWPILGANIVLGRFVKTHFAGYQNAPVAFVT